MMKKLFTLVLVVAALVVAWTAFGLWTGIYSVYSYPPSTAHPEGETLLVTREEGEPTFNSPAYIAPPKKVEKAEGIRFGTVQRARISIEERVIVRLPYVKWAYEQSLPVKPE